MRYHALKEEGIATCKTLVTQRLKRSGMRWKIAGGQAVLSFRAVIKSGRFDRAWATLIGGAPTPHQSTTTSVQLKPWCLLHDLNERTRFRSSPCETRSSHPAPDCAAPRCRPENRRQDRRADQVFNQYFQRGDQLVMLH